MPSIKIILPVLVFCQLIVAQPNEVRKSLNLDILAKHTTYFEIENHQFKDASVLTDALKDAHFVALGELHNRERLGELTSALLIHLNESGFQNFAIETGPHSAMKLQQLMNQGQDSLSDFYSRYSSKLFGTYPIPFHIGKSDIEFLEVAHSLEYNIWGLDQEYYHSFPFLIDELNELHSDSFSAEEKKIYKKISRKTKRWSKRSQVFKNFEMACQLQSDVDFLAFLNMFEESQNLAIQRIVEGIKTSLNIYCLSQQGKGGNIERIDYFKENFDEILSASENEPTKVFVKMGSMHMGRQKSYVGNKDLGNHLQEVADSLVTSSVHIKYMNRFYKGKDNLNNKTWDSYHNFIAVGKKNQWTLIDLRVIRQLLIDEKFYISNNELAEITNYDFIVIPPEDDWVVKHY